jgi:hypothetical protein
VTRNGSQCLLDHAADSIYGFVDTFFSLITSGGTVDLTTGTLDVIVSAALPNGTCRANTRLLYLDTTAATPAWRLLTESCHAGTTPTLPLADYPCHTYARLCSRLQSSLTRLVLAVGAARPGLAPSSLAFSDADIRFQFVSGTATFARAANEADITQYVDLQSA